MISPLFPHTISDAVGTINVKYRPAESHELEKEKEGVRFLEITAELLKFEDAELVESVDDAENRILAMAGTEARWIDMSGCCGGDIPTSIIINRGCNYVAARTRRGAGNVVLMNPVDVETRVEASRHLQFEDKPTYVGRWEKVASMQEGQVAIYQSADIPQGTMYVAYCNKSYEKTADGPGVLLEREGQYALHLKTNPDFLNQTESHVLRFKWNSDHADHER